MRNDHKPINNKPNTVVNNKVTYLIQSHFKGILISVHEVNNDKTSLIYEQVNRLMDEVIIYCKEMIGEVLWLQITSGGGSSHNGM